MPTNDLIEVVTKSVTYTGSGEPGMKPSINQTKADEAKVVETKAEETKTKDAKVRKAKARKVNV